MRAVHEMSAGGVIYRRRAGEIEIALIRVRNRWGLPKGHVEKGESINDTAVREVREETGLEGRVSKKLGDIGYSYRDRRTAGEPVRIHKRVHFYLMRYLKGDVGDHDHEVDEARWFPIDEAIRNLKYPTERKMVYRALNVLTARNTQKLRSEPAGEL